MSTAALLATLQMKQGELTYYTQQQIMWARMYEDNTALLKKETNKEDKWNDAYDACYSAEDDHLKKIGGTTYANNDPKKAKEYADKKVGKIEEEYLEELTEKDIQYDSMKTMYETLQKELQAEVDSLNEKVGNEAGKTYLIGGG